MTDGQDLTASARQRFSDVDTVALKEMWGVDSRTDWAETALRFELLDRGVSEQELDAIAARREEIAADAPPSARATLWNYGVVGRGLTLASVLAWVFIVHAADGSSRFAIVGALVLLGVYVYILTRRIAAQSKHPLIASARFAMNWQLGEAWLILIFTAIAAIFIFAG